MKTYEAVEWVKAALNAPGKIGVAGVEAELAAKLAEPMEHAQVVALPWQQN